LKLRTFTKLISVMAMPGFVWSLYIIWKFVKAKASGGHKNAPPNVPGYKQTTKVVSLVHTT